MSTTCFGIIVRAKQEVVRVPGVSIQELCRLCECQLSVMRRLVEYGLLEPISRGPEPLYAPASAIRARKALRLKRDLRLNFDALALVMELLDRIEELERRR